MNQQSHLKVLLWGPSYSGKTSYISILYALKKKEAPDSVSKLLTLVDEETERTLLFDYTSMEALKDLKLHVFALAGHERFSAVRKITSEGLDGALIVIRNDKNFEEDNKASLEEFVQLLKDEDVPFKVALNNIVTPDERKITIEELADQMVAVGLVDNKAAALEIIYPIDTVDAGKKLIEQIEANKDVKERKKQIDNLIKPMRELLKAIVAQGL